MEIPAPLRSFWPWHSPSWGIPAKEMRLSANCPKGPTKHHKSPTSTGWRPWMCALHRLSFVRHLSGHKPAAVAFLPISMLAWPSTSP